MTTSKAAIKAGQTKFAATALISPRSLAKGTERRVHFRAGAAQTHVALGPRRRSVVDCQLPLVPFFVLLPSLFQRASGPLPPVRRRFGPPLGGRAGVSGAAAAHSGAGRARPDVAADGAHQFVHGEARYLGHFGNDLVGLLSASTSQHSRLSLSRFS